jgi:3-hydroxybutyryl-CoA dehydratase
MTDARHLQVGQVLAHERTFIDEDVDAFQRLSGDEGRHHRKPDAQGRRVVHGLLTATIPTKLGGDIDFVGREMVFEFLRPVYVGDAIRCEMTIDEVVKEEGRMRLAMSGSCRNQAGKEVLRFSSRGVVLT